MKDQETSLVFPKIWPCLAFLIIAFCFLALCSRQHHLKGLVMTQDPALGWTQLAPHHLWLRIWPQLA